MPKAVLRLKRGHDRARVHPWIFKGDVADVGGAEPGGAVTVVDSAGRFVGRGLYNPRPALCCRIFTWSDEPLGPAFFRRRIEEAVALRTVDGTVPSLRRLVWSEADRLPGLVVDHYGPVLVVQCLTLGVAHARRTVAEALRAVAGDLAVYQMDDPFPAGLEGFEPERGWLDRAGPDAVLVEEGNARFKVTLGTGHKTGLYLDQRENRVRVEALARDRAVLDVFAHTAGFACHALRAGARSALCVESSSEAAAAARENLALNGGAERSEVREVNAFDELRRLERSKARYGLVVVDPPPFARDRRAVAAAVRGYKEINLRAMRLLDGGGHLLTFSCSHHVSEGLFEEICRDAAADAGMTLRVQGALGQSADHPVLLTVPETRYLKGLLLQVV